MACGLSSGTPSRPICIVILRPASFAGFAWPGRSETCPYVTCSGIEENVAPKRKVLASIRIFKPPAVYNLPSLPKLRLNHGETNFIERG